MILDLFTTFKEEVVKTKYLLVISLVTILYIALGVYSINYRLVFGTIFGDFPVFYKVNLLFNLFQGAQTALSTPDFILLLITAILTGINISLIIAALKYIKMNGRFRFLVGGGGLLGIVSTGCASCGFSLLSVLGLGSVLSFLPFGNHTLYIFSIPVLLFSGVYMLKKLNDSESCETDN